MVFLACLFLTAALIILKLHPIRGNPPDAEAGQSLTIYGKLKDKQYKNDSYILTLVNAAPENGDSGKTSVLIYLNSEYDSFSDLPPIGTRLSVKGDFSLFNEASNPGQFDMKKYYHTRGIEYRLFDGQIIKAGKSYDVLRESLFSLRCRMAGVYEKYLPEKDSGILKAMILGDRTSIDPDIKDLYQSCGIMHAISISGLHISILGYGLYRLLRKLSLNALLSSVLCFSFIFLYSIMVGGSTSTIRAVIMFGTCLISDLCRRSYDLLSALALSLMSILFVDPLFIYEAAFLLSFGAVMGIALIDPVLIKALPFGENRLLSGLLASISINLFTLPVILYFYYEIPLYSCFLNMVVIPCMGVLVISAVCMGLAGIFIPFFALPPGFICHLILSLYERGCQICKRIPGSSLVIGRPEMIRIAVFFILLTLLLFFWKKRERKEKRKGRRRKAAAYGYLICLMLLPLVLTVRVPDYMNYTMLDIGQGDCNVIRGADGRTIMIDCGSSSEKEIAKYRLIPFLKYSGEDTLDAVVLTHSDSDHINGVSELLSMKDTGGIKVKNLILPGSGKKDPKFSEILERAGETGTEVHFINGGESFSVGDMDFKCLSPDRGCSSGDTNEQSVVLELDYKRFSALFTGDIEGESERRLVMKLPEGKSLCVLKVAHHGSRNSTPEELLKKTCPHYALISAGRKNRYGHPHEELLKRLYSVGSEIHRTGTEGAVTVRTNGKKINISGFIKETKEENNE